MVLLFDSAFKEWIVVVYMDELPSLLYDTYNVMSGNSSQEFVRHDQQVASRRDSDHSNQEQIAYRFAIEYLQNQIARTIQQENGEEVDPHSIGRFVPLPSRLVLDENDPAVRDQILSTTRSFLTELERLFAQTEETEHIDPDRFACIGYDQFVSSIHCQFFHTGIQFMERVTNRRKLAVSPRALRRVLQEMPSAVIEAVQQHLRTLFAREVYDNAAPAVQHASLPDTHLHLHHFAGRG